VRQRNEKIKYKNDACQNCHRESFSFYDCLVEPATGRIRNKIAKVGASVQSMQTGVLPLCRCAKLKMLEMIAVVGLNYSLILARKFAVSTSRVANYSASTVNPGSAMQSVKNAVLFLCKTSHLHSFGDGRNSFVE